MIRNRPPSSQTRLILHILLSHPGAWRHGYELSKLTGLSSGTLYPLLMRLEQRGFLDSRWEDAERPGRPPRHAYRLSHSGVALAHEHGKGGPEPDAEAAREALA